MRHKVLDPLSKHWVGYEPETGELFRENEAEWYIIDPYIFAKAYKIDFNGQRVFIHNVIWYIMTGDWPIRSFLVRHRDGDQRNNKWVNLYKETFSEDSRQHKKRVDNSSGYIGVTRYRNRRKDPYKYFFKAIIDGEVHQKCSFKTPYDAALARDQYILEINDQFATLNILTREERQVK